MRSKSVRGEGISYILNVLFKNSIHVYIFSIVEVDIWIGYN